VRSALAEGKCGFEILVEAYRLDDPALHAWRRAKAAGRSF
jgi:hypothetical protein